MTVAPLPPSNVNENEPANNATLTSAKIVIPETLNATLTSEEIVIHETITLNGPRVQCTRHEECIASDSLLNTLKANTRMTKALKADVEKKWIPLFFHLVHMYNGDAENVLSNIPQFTFSRPVFIKHFPELLKQGLTFDQFMKLDSLLKW